MSLLQMSFSGAILIIAVIIIRAAAMHRLPKKTFLILWGIVLMRLLIPFKIPSVYSAYSFVNQKIPTHASLDMPLSASPVSDGQPYELTEGTVRLPADLPSAVSLGYVIWFTGMAVCAAFFLISYLRCRLEFQTSLPVQNDFIEQWLKDCLLRRRISVRKSDRILAPLTYGIVRPVILMPENTDWNHTEQLQYILLHEYVHICRFDALTKLFCVFALCIHWFNPLVWVMYILFNRDLELACDESVIRRLGVASRSSYAGMLIHMEAKKSGLMPFGNYFSKNAVEERITAIMKIKKTSIAAVFVAALLIAGVSIAFATSAAEDENEKNDILSAGFSEEEIDRLFALQVDGYEDMSISRYQNRIWKMTDTIEYRELLERFSGNTRLYELRDSNEIASYFFYTLEPLTAERWNTREFDGYCTADNPEISDSAILEFFFTLTIQDADALTVREYNAARAEMMHGMQNLLQDKTTDQLWDEISMQETLRAETEELTKKQSTDALQITVEYVYQPPSELMIKEEDSQKIQTEQERREYPNATEEDYRSLLTLKTPSYQDMSIEDFNRELLAWANEDYERMERINCDIVYNDIAVLLTSDELPFVTLTVNFSGIENGMYVRSSYTGEPEEDPSYSQSLPEKYSEEKNGVRAWCDLYYQFSYHIADKKSLTVGERDRRISGLMRSVVHEFWNQADTEDILKMTKEDVVRKLGEIAAGYSDDSITITIPGEYVSFEYMDERDIALD